MKSYPYIIHFTPSYLEHWFAPVICVSLFQGGIYLYQLVDWYFAAFCVVVISFLECFLISWVYGMKCFDANIGAEVLEQTVQTQIRLLIDWFLWSSLITVYTVGKYASYILT